MARRVTEAPRGCRTFAIEVVLMVGCAGANARLSGGHRRQLRGEAIASIEPQAAPTATPIVSAEGANWWETDDVAGLPARTDAEIVSFDKRVARSTWPGYPDAKGRAERPLPRDRAHDDLR